MRPGIAVPVTVLVFMISEPGVVCPDRAEWLSTGGYCVTASSDGLAATPPTDDGRLATPVIARWEDIREITIAHTSDGPWVVLSGAFERPAPHNFGPPQPVRNMSILLGGLPGETLDAIDTVRQLAERHCDCAVSTHWDAVLITPSPPGR